MFAAATLAIDVEYLNREEEKLPQTYHAHNCKDINHSARDIFG